MAELRDSYKFSNVNELEFAVGTAIRTMGPETVLNAIPLQVWEIYWLVLLQVFNLLHLKNWLI